MDANRETAKECRASAEANLSTGNFEKALKLAEKAEKLFGTIEGKDLIHRVQRASANESQNSSAKPKTNPATAPMPTKSKSAPAAKVASSAPKAGVETRTYTNEQVNLVKQARASKDLYKILGIERDANEDTIKKAYKKLAILLHPDKNPAPGADEAFKAVGMAYQVLADAGKRRQYDVSGDIGGPTGADSHHGFHNFGGGERIDPEEILRMFFQQSGAGFGAANRMPRQRRQQAPVDADDHSPAFPLQNVLFFAVVALLLATNTFMSAPQELDFSWSLTSPFFVRRDLPTPLQDVKYYVKESFAKEFLGDSKKKKLKEFELIVERKWEEALILNCQKEKRQEEFAAASSPQYRKDRGTNNPRKSGVHCLKLHDFRKLQTPT